MILSRCDVELQKRDTLKEGTVLSTPMRDVTSTPMRVQDVTMSFGCCSCTPRLKGMPTTIKCRRAQVRIKSVPHARFLCLVFLTCSSSGVKR